MCVDFIIKNTGEVIFSTSEDNAKDIIKDIDILYANGSHQVLKKNTISIDDIEYIVDSIAWRNNYDRPISFPLDKVFLIPAQRNKKKGDDDVSIP